VSIGCDRGRETGGTSYGRPLTWIADDRLPIVEKVLTGQRKAHGVGIGRKKQVNGEGEGEERTEKFPKNEDGKRSPLTIGV